MESPEDVLITGISGRFPDCDNMIDLSESLLAGVDLVTDTNKNGRYPTGTLSFFLSQRIILITR